MRIVLLQEIFQCLIISISTCIVSIQPDAPCGKLIFRAGILTTQELDLVIVITFSIWLIFVLADTSTLG